MGIRLSNEEAFAPRRDLVKVDFIDLLIVHEMQRNAFFRINQLQKSLNINPKTLRYHFTSHLVKNRLIAGYAISYAGLNRKNNGTKDRPIGIIVKVKNASSYEKIKLQEISLKLPFSWNYAYSSKTRTFYLMLYTPSEYLNVLLSKITDNFIEFNERIENVMLDYKKVRSFTIPIALYDRELNDWIFNEPKALTAVQTTLGTQKVKNLDLI
jgi:DNA-binding Lrp family transcriptional regulator